MDLDALTDDDLAKLKAADPFLYYSVPAPRRASFRDTDAADVPPPSPSAAAAPRRRFSLPVHVGTGAQQRPEGPAAAPAADGPGRRTSIRRNSRLSTEAHPTLLCEELLGELGGLGDGLSDLEWSDDEDFESS